MKVQKNEQETINTGTRLEAFVKDSDVQAAIARMATRNFSDFKKATSADALRTASAKAAVLDEFLSELQVDIDRGQVARINRTERERREQGRTQPS